MERNGDDLAGDLELLRGAATDLVAGGTFSIEGLAARHGTSVRTLQRRCRALGVTPRELIDEARVRLAGLLLLKPELGIEEVASALGYSSSRTFRRAVRRWTGTSPSELRSAISQAALDSNECSSIVEGMSPPEHFDSDPADINHMETLRRSIAMSQPGSWALKREPALQVLGQLVQELRTSRVQ